MSFGVHTTGAACSEHRASSKKQGSLGLRAPCFPGEVRSVWLLSVRLPREWAGAGFGNPGAYSLAALGLEFSVALAAG